MKEFVSRFFKRNKYRTIHPINDDSSNVPVETHQNPSLNQTIEPTATSQKNTQEVSLSELAITTEQIPKPDKICIFFCDDMTVQAKAGFSNIIGYLERANLVKKDAKKRAAKIDAVTGYGVFEENNIMVVVAENGKIMLDKYINYHNQHLQDKITAANVIISDYEMSKKKIIHDMSPEEKNKRQQEINDENGIVFIRNIDNFHNGNGTTPPDMMILTANELTDLTRDGLKDSQCKTVAKIKPGTAIQTFLNDIICHKFNMADDVSHIINGTSTGSVGSSSAAEDSTQNFTLSTTVELNGKHGRPRKLSEDSSKEPVK